MYSLTCAAAPDEGIKAADSAADLIKHLNVPYVPNKLQGSSADISQTLDIYRPEGVQKAPIIVYVHGGGWAFGDKSDVNLKPDFFALQGIAFISINYRLRWDYKIYDQLTDIVTALKWVNTNAARYNLDGSRIVLMGHAAGGHLASLIMTDSSYFKAESVTPDFIKAVVSISSNSYDIPRLMRELGSFVERRQHELVFGRDEAVWKAASPITHIGKSSTLAPFALMYEPDSDASRLQAKDFARVLVAHDVNVIMIPGSEERGQIDQMIGQSGNPATAAMMAFIRSQI